MSAFTSSSDAIKGFGFEAFCSFGVEGVVTCGASEAAMGAVCAILTLRFRATNLLIRSLSAVTAVFISRINISSVTVGDWKIGRIQFLMVSFASPVSNAFKRTFCRRD